MLPKSIAIYKGSFIRLTTALERLMNIPLAAAIGVPLYLRIEMAIPLLSVLLTKGMSMGAAMSLLIGGTGIPIEKVMFVGGRMDIVDVPGALENIRGITILRDEVYRYTVWHHGSDMIRRKTSI